MDDCYAWMMDGRIGRSLEILGFVFRSFVGRLLGIVRVFDGVGLQFTGFCLGFCGVGLDIV